MYVHACNSINTLLYMYLNVLVRVYITQPFPLPPSLPSSLFPQPENILISGVEDNPIIKLIDFGSAQELNGDITLVASSSPEFSAPEIISQEGVWLVADMWSVGVLTYVL